MPPQEQPNPTQQPSSPASQFDFITSNPQQQNPGSRFRLPKVGSRLPILILVGLIGLIILIIIFSSVFGSKGGKAEDLVRIMARATEIARVSALADQESNDSELKNIASTAKSTLTSDSAQIGNYLSSNGKKVKDKSLAIYANPNTDTELKSANQTNSLDSYYYSYLKQELGKYQQALKAFYATAPQSSKQILQDAYDSAEIILSSEQLSDASSY